MSDVDEDELVPPASVCEERIQKFVQVTGTDEAYAQMVLQNNDWDLDKGVQMHFESLEPDKEYKSARNLPLVGADGNFQPLSTTTPPDNLTVMTWNIDSLSEKNLTTRVDEVCKIIEDRKVSLVFLQEVTSETWAIIKQKMSNYTCISTEGYKYFTATLFRKKIVYLDDFQTIPYPTSAMGRDLFLANCHVGKAKLVLVNTHLESTKEHSDERVRQLHKCFKTMNDQDEDKTVIFGGDLNLRDSEIKSGSMIPPGIDDLWIRTGSRKECQYTWDTMRNTNLEFAGRFKPRCRFDRLYIKDSNPQRLIPDHFGLEGIQKISGYQCFPSDHWAILVVFKVKSS